MFGLTWRKCAVSGTKWCGRGHVYMVGRRSRAGDVFSQCMLEEGETELFGRRRVVIGVCAVAMVICEWRSVGTR